MIINSLFSKNKSVLQNKSIIGFIELLIANTFWGLGFVATVWCLRDISPSAILFYRFTMAFILSLMTYLFLKRKQNLADILFVLRTEVKLAFLPGVFLFLTLLLQTWGLKYTTATKSGFITILYVLIIPFIEIIHQKTFPSVQHWLLTLLALVGTLFMIEIFQITNSGLNLNFGDFLTLLCAFTAAFHIYFIGIRSNMTSSGLLLNGFQSLWCALLALPFLFYENNFYLTDLQSLTWIGLLALGVGSSFLAFFLQVKAQTEINASIAAVLFLMESPFAAMFGFIFLGETMSHWQIIGAILIFISCVLITQLESSTRFSDAKNSH